MSWEELANGGFDSGHYDQLVVDDGAMKNTSATPFTAAEEEELRKVNAAGPLLVPQSAVNVASEAVAPAKQLFAAPRRPSTAQGCGAARPMSEDEVQEAASQLGDIFASWDAHGRGLLARSEFERRLRELSQVCARHPEKPLSSSTTQPP